MAAWSEGGGRIMRAVRLRLVGNGLARSGGCKPIVRWDGTSHGCGGSLDAGNRPGGGEGSLSETHPEVHIGAIGAYATA